MSRVRKLNVSGPIIWPHHRSGWTAVIDLIRNELHTDDGTLFVSAVEELIGEGNSLRVPWVGFVHQVPKTNLRWYPDLDRLLRHPGWMSSLPHCRGLFTLSSYLRDFLIACNLPVPVARLLYPLDDPCVSFSLERFLGEPVPKVLFIGEYLRNHAAFYELPADGFRKVLLAPDKYPPAPDSVEVLNRVSNEAYDALLGSSVVFLNLFDAPANTTVMECMARNTPLLINRLPGVEEYLGEAYPLFYDTLAEAEQKLQNVRLLREAAEYLRQLPIKQRMTPAAFIDSLTASAVYRSLPVPNSQQQVFKSYDVTVLICSYRRVHNIAALLQALAAQTFQGTFEIILWNNNWEARDALDAIVAGFERTLDIRLIHSSLNYYCIVRLAVAQLMRSTLLLICDDDVSPAAGYIAHFLDKHAEYGRDAVLCCRGHVFRPHVLNEEEPSEFWQQYEHMTFYDESANDRQVHFMHADNCLIPRHILKQLGQIDIPEYEFIVVDDYWLSFVLSHRFQIPIWKIKANQVLAFIPSAEDPAVALYHNQFVQEQRVRLYIHHMRQGWPPMPKTDSPAVQPAPAVTPRRYGDVWEGGFCGVNMFSEAPEADFRAAAEYGLAVIRIGATHGANDLRYLVDADGEHSVVSDETVARLRRALMLADRYGLRVILTLTHLPGRLFHTRGGESDLRMWTDPDYARRIVHLWSELAGRLADVPTVIGYDLINEPFTPDDTQRALCEYSASTTSAALDELYSQLIHAIRRHDPRMMLVLEPACWANPFALPSIRTIPDERVAYSFHMYLPHCYTIRADNDGQYRYPGTIPRWPQARNSEREYWDKSKLEALLSGIETWQSAQNIPSQRIFVGEFGVCRELTGAKQYLTDLTATFNANSWSWCVYAFRDDEWDAMDYELGDDAANMLDRRGNPLFETLARQFR